MDASDPAIDGDARLVAAAAGPSPWRALLARFAAVLAAAGLGLAAFVFAFDPYGAGPLAGLAPPALMDINQRFMYPQVIRSHAFDSAVIGTSTVRLLNPARLDPLFSARTVNLGMNAATPWEQARIADLFLRETPDPALMIFGIDAEWCAQDAASPAKRLTFRAFPDSFYDDNRWNDWPYLFNLHSIEISWRLAMHRLRFKRQRLPMNGYEVFTPNEALYDVGRARTHIYGDTGFGTSPPARAPKDPVAPDQFRFPALAWLEDLLARLPARTSRFILFPPAHAAGYFPADTREGSRMEACKAQATRIAERRGATLVDFRVPSRLTQDDANYWDHLHYRLPVAERITQALVDAQATGRDAPDGTYRVLAWARKPGS
ncbi:hypothetical protein ABEG18_05045 [Alsobacter sp. KACC 23698]|uniref:SGNH/GDSL hydrolase family protein n=1 Tax=Alsobacter sp. KACC 23698 TaxID=3149229 RepID=A0AAU7JIM4_9HYPH